MSDRHAQQYSLFPDVGQTYEVLQKLNVNVQKYMRTRGSSEVPMTTQKTHQSDMFLMARWQRIRLSKDTGQLTYLWSLDFLHHLLKKRMRSLSWWKSLSPRILTQLGKGTSRGWQLCHLSITTQLDSHHAYSASVVGLEFLSGEKRKFKIAGQEN